jgi:hypothetical protein
MLMWGDRLIDSSLYYGSKWEASNTGSHRAIDLVPKDIIMCDWHYDRRPDYPPIRYFQQKGFRVLPSTWKTPDAAVALIRCSRKDATERMLGILFTGWSAGGNGEHLLPMLQAKEDAGEVQKPGGKGESPRQVARQIADTIRAGMKELAAPEPPATWYAMQKSRQCPQERDGPDGRLHGHMPPHATIWQRPPGRRNHHCRRGETHHPQPQGGNRPAEVPASVPSQSNCRTQRRLMPHDPPQCPSPGTNEVLAH